MESDINLGYAGFYARFDTVSKKEAAVLNGADNLVGDRFSIVFETEDGTTTAWIQNKFGARVGYLDEDASRRLQICAARGWNMVALLSFVAYSSTPEPGEYWGEVACICYNPANNADAFEAFIDTIGSMMADSIRPDVSLSSDGVNHVISSHGTWKPNARVPLPQKTQGMAILKRRRKISESFIEAGRAGNKGCYAVSWIFIILVIAALLVGGYFGLRAFGVL